MSKSPKIFSSLLLFFLLIFGAWLFLPKTAHAQDTNFHTTLKTTYTVSELGTTNVDHAFTIKNLTPAYFISKYGLQLSSKNISNIGIVDSGKSIPAEIVKTDTMTSIGITFPDKVLGEHKTRDFSLSYSDPDIAHINGNVLEVTIPQLADSGKYDSYSVVLVTPIKFGKPNRVTPGNYSLKQDVSSSTMTFNKPSGKGISAIFGDKQVFNLDLSYHLDNPNNQPVVTQIALPPDTPYQRLRYNSIDPLPEKIEVDDDGNWIATFLLASNTTTTVKANAQALLTLEPNTDIPSSQPNKKHTNEQEFWGFSMPEIASAANDNQTPQDIYNFTTSNLTYTKEDISSDLERLGALQALINPTLATCQEFTDVFISLSRANNIPSRRITGYALTNDSSLRPLSLVDDILHAWPEYFSEEKQLWIPIDPTWGSTTGGVDYFNQFDLNHITFAINGESSTLPYPAGAYKLEGAQGKNIEVSVGESVEDIEPNISTDLRQKTIGPVSTPGSYELIITNPTGQAWYNIALDLTTTNNSDIKLHATDTSISALLPFQSLTIPVSVYNSSGIAPSADEINLVITLNKTPISISTWNVSTAPPNHQKPQPAHRPCWLGRRFYPHCPHCRESIHS